MNTLELAALAAAVAGAGALVLFARPATLLSLTLAATLLSGHSHEVGLPLPDRLLLVATLGALLLWPDPDAGRRVRRIRRVDVLLLVAGAVGIASAVAVGTITEEGGLFRLLDAYGIVPFVAFAIAHRVFRTEQDRQRLVTVLLVVGAYLSVTAVLESIDADGWIWPHYIADRTVGIHQDRARGPFVEAAANGLALFVCAVAAGVRAHSARRATSRALAVLVGLACLLGVLLTLTRAAWLGAALGAIAGMLVHPRLRRHIPVLAASAAIVVIAALAWIPGLSGAVDDRSAAERPVWDRLNTNETALAVIADRPLFGVGWNRFVEVNADYARQADDRPLTGTHLVAHNVVLANVAELGLVGGGIWLLALGTAVATAWRGSVHLPRIWRAAMVAVVADWVVVAMFSPLGYAFANLALWIFLGVAAAPLATRPRRTAEADDDLFDRDLDLFDRELDDPDRDELELDDAGRRADELELDDARRGPWVDDPVVATARPVRAPDPEPLTVELLLAERPGGRR